MVVHNEEREEFWLLMMTIFIHIIIIWYLTISK